ncbi:MAG: hypothetical protein J7501_04375 [Bdellovibrio sp.]|nr:hypothetical protein [Bdellovibrio sp.]
MTGGLTKILLVKKGPGILLGLFALVLVLQSQLHLPSSVRQSRELIAPPEMMEHFVFGYNEPVADSLWIRVLQDFDYCDKPLNKNYCQSNSWLFRMLDSITELSPYFRIPYAAGGLALSVLITDVDGAAKIFDKGVRNLPNDWTIKYRAAYHYLYEVKDKQRAADLLTQAGKLGAPPWVFTLAGRLYSDSGELDLAENLLKEMKNSNQDPSFIKRLQDKIDSMKKSRN